MSRTNIEALKNLYAKIANTTADAINPHTQFVRRLTQFRRRMVTVTAETI